MTRLSRTVLKASAGGAALLLILTISAILVLRSEWFRRQIHARMIFEVEKATGGRVESGPLAFDWRHLRGRVQNFVLHGTEPAAADPLFRASSITVGLRILSVLHKRVELNTLDVQQPRIHLIIGPDGSTNVPRPKLRAARKNALETILDLAVRHFVLAGGRFTVDGQTARPFSAKGDRLRAVFLYQAAAARYQGDLSVQPLDLQWGDHALLPAGVSLSMAVERNRIRISSGSLISGKSRVDFSGAFDNVVAAQGAFRYKAEADLQEIGHTLRTPVFERGTAQVEGDLHFAGLANLSATGKLAVAGMNLRIHDVRVEEARATAAFLADIHHIAWQDLRVSGSAATDLNRTRSRFPIQATIRNTVLRAEGIEAGGVTVEMLGGRFTGRADFPNLRRFRVDGQIESFDIRRMAALLTPNTIPWDGQAAGPLRLDGSLTDRRDVAVDAQVAISPALAGPAVTGSVALHYDVGRGLLDLGHSSVFLPHSQVNFSGMLGSVATAARRGSSSSSGSSSGRSRQGANLQVHLRSEDLADLIPALNLVSDHPPEALPVQLRNGKAAFEGSVSGPLAEPRIEGRVSLASFTAYGRAFDSFHGNVSLSPTGVALRDGAVTHGPARARLSGSIALEEWKPRDSSAVSGSLDMQQASIANLLALGGQANLPVDGTVSVTGRLSGTYGQPHGEGDLVALKGQIYGEPFDRLAGKLLYTGDTAQLNGVQLIAGTKQLTLSAAYRHNPGDLTKGRVRFEVSSNAMGLDQFQVITRQFPGIGGVLQVKASGEIETAHAAGQPFRINNLNGEATAGSLHLEQRQFGNLRVTATSKGNSVFGVLDSDFAGAEIHGTGQFQLSGDNPGTARVTFAGVRLGRAERALALLPAGFEIGGATEGTLTVEGPALNPDLWKASLQIPRFRVAPAPQSGLGAQRQDFALSNSGPIRISMDRRVIKIESARFIGRTTDLSLSGSATLAQRSPLDLRINGRIDLAMLQDFSPDLTAAGTVLTDATIRGPLRRPLVNGRLEVKNASMSLVDFPNGLSNGNGVILFNGNGATIESLNGETGGGKVSITGFAGYEANQAVFRLVAKASQVRVRYPEGVSTVADAALNWTGTSEGNILSGTVTILHSGFNPRSDLGSILTQSSQPVRTPAARTGLLGSTRFDIEIATSPVLTVQSSLTQGMVMEGNLRLRGTFSNPALLGRINIVQGQLVFFGTKYTIDQGAISFYNPVRVEPVVNMDLQTKARGVEVILNISGPLNKLALTPRSDPPLPFGEIVSLLATGRTPSSVDMPVAASSQVTNPQGYQQMGASALLAEAVSSPVAGRLQRFFGITKLRIDPTLTGIEFNPQARITLEQQITPNITFTYITNVTNSNPLVVQVEWALNTRWSVIAVRDENGLFGLDFFYKKRFR
jgi:translocation and assembly module TamB